MANQLKTQKPPQFPRRPCAAGRPAWPLGRARGPGLPSCPYAHERNRRRAQASGRAPRGLSRRSGLVAGRWRTGQPRPCAWANRVMRHAPAKAQPRLSNVARLASRRSVRQAGLALRTARRKVKMAACGFIARGRLSQSCGLTGVTSVARFREAREHFRVEPLPGRALPDGGASAEPSHAQACVRPHLPGKKGFIVGNDVKDTWIRIA